MFRSWNGTPNALEAYINNNYGVPIVLDELSTSRLGQFTEILYSLSEGQGRQRQIFMEVLNPSNNQVRQSSAHQNLVYSINLHVMMV